MVWRKEGELTLTRNPSHCGAAKGQLETLRILGGHGGNLWLRNVKGDYPLHEAVSSGRKELVRWLLAQRPDAVNSPNNDGRCPLHIAAINNNVEMCKIILDGQALLNPVMRTSKGHLMTPMDAALHRSNRGCAKYLQLHGGVPANKLTDKTASIRGGSHREKLAMSETQSEQFTTPECLNTLPVPGSRGSLVSSPMGDVSDRTRTLQVRLSDDIAIRHVEKIEGPLLCRHYYDDDDSSEEERKQRRRRRRRKRNNLLEEDVRRRWQRNIYSDRDSDEKKEKGLRRKWRTGHLSDRDNDGDTSRMKHLSETNQRISHSEESEDYEDKEESDYEQVQNENKHNNIRNTFKDNSEVGNTSNVEYVTVKKTTIKTKKTRVKSKTDEEEVKETQQESDNNKKGKEKIARLEVEDSTIERSESREREVIKRTVKSSVVKEKKQKEKPKLKEEINKTKVNINKEIKVKGKTEKNKNTIQSKNSSDKINNTNTKKYKGSANTKDCLENNSLSQTPSEDTKDQTKQKERQTMESSSSNDKLVGSTSFEEEHIKSQTPSLDEENNGKLTQTIVTAIVHQQDIAEDPFNIQEQEENSLRVQKESDDAKIVLENENDKIEETDDISALFGGEYDKEDKTEVKEEKRENEQLFENSIGEMKGDEEAIEKEQITFEEESNESTCNIEHFDSIKSDSTNEMLKVEINNETILDGDENCNEQKNNSYISKSDEDETDKHQHEHVSIEEFETELSENKREHVITTEGEENHDNCGTETNDPNLQEDENEVKPDIDDDYENTTKISDEIKGRSSEDYSKAEVAETSEQTESVAQTGDEAQELEKDEDIEVTSILNKDKETWVETAHTTATSSPTGRDDEEEIDESGASTGHSRNEDSSILLDSGFEPSPRHDKEKKPDKIRTGSLGTGRGRSKSGRVQRPCRSGLEDSRPPINTSSVTRSVQNSMRNYNLVFVDQVSSGEEDISRTASVTVTTWGLLTRYHLERRIFHELLVLQLQLGVCIIWRGGYFKELLELKRLQIRAGRANEQVLVKRLVDDYQKAGLDIGLQKYEGPFTFRNFEKYLYEQLRLLQTSDRRLVPRLRSSDDLEKLSVVLRKARLNNKILNDVPDNPILCTHGTHRCHHAAHAYTGIPCAAYSSHNPGSYQGRMSVVATQQAHLFLSSEQNIQC
uniref:Uncharacterized protein n=1 Tax=Timema cristinae TaxID=61476 RepID=A0A7R9D211_TIMCR|nr:unnamed protein product [Timema cristinae]